MKRRLFSHYGYETHFNGASLTLRPGLNLVEQDAYDDAIRSDARFKQVMASGRVGDDGRHIDWLKDLVTRTPEEVTREDVNAMSSEEAQALIRALGKNTAAIRLLSGLAERGGIKAAFTAALEGRG